MIRSSLIAVILVAGCSAARPSNPQQHPIVGRWVLNIAKTSPAAAKDPSLANAYSSTLTFSSDGEYRGVSRWNGPPDEVTGTFRTDGPDVYLNTGNGERKALFEIQGSYLLVHDKREPGVLVYERR